MNEFAFAFFPLMVHYLIYFWTLSPDIPQPSVILLPGSLAPHTFLFHGDAGIYLVTWRAMAKCATALTRPTCHPWSHTPAKKPPPAFFGAAFTGIPQVSFPEESLPLARASRSTGGRNCDRGLGQSRLSLTPSQTT